MRALYPVVGAGAVDVFSAGTRSCPPVDSGAMAAAPCLFPVYGTKGCASLLQCMWYIQVVGITIRSGLLE